MELIASGAASLHPSAETLLDIGCGAGNYSLKLMQKLPLRSVTCIDLSKPMLDRAVQRIRAADGHMHVRAIQGDIRLVELEPEAFDVAVAAATLHHLREEDEWRAVFRKICEALKPGGSFWIWDMVTHQPHALHDCMWQRYGEYLTGVGGVEYRDRVFAYIDKEDTPRPLVWQLDQLSKAGFRTVEILHKNACFAAFGGIKA